MLVSGTLMLHICREACAGIVAGGHQGQKALADMTTFTHAIELLE